MAPQQRQASIKQESYCINCLQQHDVIHCTQLCKCRHCGKQYSQNHTTSLHTLYIPQVNSPRVSHGATNNSSLQSHRHLDGTIPSTSWGSKEILNHNVTSNASVNKVHIKRKGLLTRISAIQVINARTWVSSKVYAQHDLGSEITLVSTNLADELGLVSEGSSKIALHTVSGSKVSDFKYTSFVVETLHARERFQIQKALVMPTWSNQTYILPQNYDLSTYQHFEDVNIETLPNRKHIDILLGLDNSNLMMVLEERMGAQNQPHAIHTPIGWVASGGNTIEENLTYRSMKMKIHPVLDDKMQKVVELQEIIRDLTFQDKEIQLSVSDKKAQKVVESGTRVIEGRYEMPVPFKDNLRKLSNNYLLAFKRLKGPRQKMLKSPEREPALQATMKMLKQNHYKTQANEVTDRQVKYLPYFLTHQTRPRVVYDGSAKCDELSINDCIYSGPDSFNFLAHVLAKFLLGKYDLMSDLSKCFFQIRLPEATQDLFRILWYKDDDVKLGEVEAYKFTRHACGVVSSPYIACAAIRKAADENPTNSSNLTTETIRRCMYMDDLLFSSHSIEEAQLIADESVKLFDSRGFKLVKWSACRTAKPVITKMNEDLLAPAVRTLDLKTGQEPPPDFKAVGCIWNTEEDTLKVQLSTSQPLNYTRRSLLSQLSSQYDPLGYCAPLFLKGRLILQQLALTGHSWDEPIKHNYVKAWNRWLMTLDTWRNLFLPRWYFANSSLTESQCLNAEWQLHAFSDASNEAYGCVVYIRRKIGNVVYTSFVFGKSRVVLNHQQKWPLAKKELVAAVIAVDFMQSAFKALLLPERTKSFWCDSKVVMQ